MGRIKLIHYHTDAKDAVPSASNLALGEIAVNTNPESPQLIIKNSKNQLVRGSFLDSRYISGNYSGKNHFKFAEVSNPSQWDNISGCFAFRSLGSGTGILIIGIHGTNMVEIKFWGESNYSQIPITARKNDKKISFFVSERNVCIFDFINLISVSNLNLLERIETYTDDTVSQFGDIIATANFNVANKTHGTLTINGFSFIGEKDLTIDKLDCGEF